ncbi:MAG: 50S ribosomal protein L29 [Saprospiraceae bacterium]|uniref:Large ribosomal subunit protein uL29 n=1 Tax=Candidatus Opimibacter skivensis TaxID=2982028 RepID=A0A9D7SW48_9BACT|nr:50S ribosomal protein L29 [Candidatus Opimibacter skivensis]HZV71931.1 50S ribosomal protein L29 [Saprospiraceae bacterium]
MATKKFIELGEMSDTDLKAELTQMNGQYHKLRFDHTIKGLDNPVTLRSTRRDIARIQTEMRRREMTTMSPEQTAKRSRIRSRRKKA